MEPITAVKMFALLLPIWQQRPIATEDIMPGRYPLLVEPARIEFAAQGFDSGDYELRGRLAQNLGKTQNGAATAQLLARIGAEGDIDAAATLLAQLRNLPLVDPAITESIEPFLDNEAAQLRYWAALLYADSPNAAAAPLLTVAGDDPYPRVRLAAASGLARHADGLDMATLKPLLDDPDPSLRARAWAAACRVADAGSATDAFHGTCDDQAPGVRTAVARGLTALPGALGVELCVKLCTDQHASVRASAAETAGRLRAANVLPSLLTLAVDPDREVRRTAVASLAEYPVGPAAKAVVRAYGDPAPFVREQAEESAVALHPRFGMIELTGERVTDPNVDARFRVYHVLGRLNATGYKQAVAEALRSEERPENMAAALQALFQLRSTEFPDLILSYAGHESAIVRHACAQALGNIHRSDAFEVLVKLIFDDKLTVGRMAVESAGRLRDSFFAPTLLKVLRDTGLTAHFSSMERGAACWAAARLESPDPDLAKRLLQQATTPVIQTLMGPVFEPDFVLVSASFALTEYARQDDRYRPTAEKTIAKHSRELGAGEYPGPGQLYPTPELREYARQAQAHLAGQPVEPGVRPTRTMRLLYRPTAE